MRPREGAALVQTGSREARQPEFGGAKAVAASHFEVPIVRDANACGDHNEAFKRGIEGGLATSGHVGNLSGIAVFALLVLVF